MNLPGYRLHPLSGDRRGQWSVRVSGNWRIVFRFEDGEAIDVTLGRLPLDARRPPCQRCSTLPTPGESLRDALEAEGWTVTQAAAKLGCTRQTLSRVLNGRTGVSPAMALALEGIGWSNAAFWVRRQAQYDLAQERMRRQQAVA